MKWNWDKPGTLLQAAPEEMREKTIKCCKGEKLFCHAGLGQYWYLYLHVAPLQRFCQTLDWLNKPAYASVTLYNLSQWNYNRTNIWWSLSEHANRQNTNNSRIWKKTCNLRESSYRNTENNQLLTLKLNLRDMFVVAMATRKVEDDSQWRCKDVFFVFNSDR